MIRNQRADSRSSAPFAALAALFAAFSADAQQTVFYNDETEWSQAVTALEPFDTTSLNVALAFEIEASETPVNTFLGRTLTYDSSATGLSRSFVARVLQDIGPEFGWTWNDQKLPGGEQALSPNDVDNGDDDDFEIEVTSGPPLEAFGMWIVHNNDSTFGVESLSVYDALDQLLGRTDLSEAGFPGGEALFLGVVADRPIARVVFDEDDGTDDIGVRDFRFARGSGAKSVIDRDLAQSQVNTTTLDRQLAADVAVAPAGNFVVVWEDSVDVSGVAAGVVESNVRAQAYDVAGHAVGGELMVNSYATGSQRTPAVTATPDGEFLVVWSGWGADGFGTQVRWLSSAGVPLGSEFLVSSPAANAVSPDVDAGPGGDIVVAWHAGFDGTNDTSSFRVEARRLDGDGLPVGAEFEVNQYTTDQQRVPRVAVSADGTFVVVWQSNGSGGNDGYGYSIQARRFAANGTPLGDDIQVNDYVSGSQRAPAVAALAEGGFVVVWQSECSFGTDCGSYGIHGRRFDDGSDPLELEFQVNSTTTGLQLSPAVVAAAEGFTVVWSDASTTGRIALQSFSGHGAPVGSEEQVSTQTLGSPAHPRIAAGPSGDLVVAWETSFSPGDDQDQQSVQMRRLALPIFADGFESGDTSRWGP